MIEESLKDYCAAERKGIKKIAKEISFLAQCVRAREEPRLVQCVAQIDWRGNRMELIRGDTGEVVDSRPLTAEERQAVLPMGESEVMKNVRIVTGANDA